MQLDRKEMRLLRLERGKHTNTNTHIHILGVNYIILLTSPLL